MQAGTGSRNRSLQYEHPAAFWFGVAAVTVGVLMHLPFYFSARHDHYILAGKIPDASMWFGMALILVGLASTAYGLFPRLSENEPDARECSPRGSSATATRWRAGSCSAR